jgi:hypothetical protein
MTTMIGLRDQCRCGGTEGRIMPKNGQDCVYCTACGKWQYNAPRLETGRAVRTLTTRPGITPGQRARVLAVHDHACIGCGKRPPEVRLELEHLIAREDAARHDMLDEVIDSEFNLAPMCPECNSGYRPLGSVSIRLLYRALLMKAMPA